METELFTYDEWEFVDESILMFMAVDLVIKIGQFEANTHFDTAVIDHANGILTLGTGEIEHKFKLHYRVGEPIDSV
jgi:hypothetical protein